MAAQHFDIAVVGHFSADVIKLPSSHRPCYVLGGAVAYVSLTAKLLGASTSVVSKVGKDFPLAYFQFLQGKGVDLSGLVNSPCEATTSFELDYNSDLSTRALRLRGHSSPILSSDLPCSLHAKVVHIAPIVDEISFEVVVHLKRYCSCLSLDPQGMMRRFDTKGNVDCLAKINDRILPLVNVYKSSVEEISVLTGESDVERALKAVHDFGPEVVIATMGSKGSMMFTMDNIRRVPAYESERVVDPTGAGDAFIGGFLAEYIKQKNPLWCACVGSASASSVVENVGLQFLGDKAEIYRRACVVYEKEIKR